MLRKNDGFQNAKTPALRQRFCTMLLKKSSPDCLVGVQSGESPAALRCSEALLYQPSCSASACSACTSASGRKLPPFSGSSSFSYGITSRILVMFTSVIT